MSDFLRFTKINNFNDFIYATQESSEDFKRDLKQLDTGKTVIILLKLKTFEFEYYSNTYKNGFAVALFEHLLSLPDSKTWGLVAQDVVGVLKYWLGAIMNVNDIDRWWEFVNLILRFIRELLPKNQIMPNVIVNLLSKPLISLASGDTVSLQQRLAMLSCFNTCGAVSSRHVRLNLKHELADNLKQLARHVLTCGFFPVQLLALETLVRWLVPRQDPTLRASTAQLWFPVNFCPQAVKDIFINATWMNFNQDSRNFLNALNEGNGLVISVICRRFCIGEHIIVSGSENLQHWLDINSSTISVMVGPQVMDRLGESAMRDCEAIVFRQSSTLAVKLHRCPNSSSICDRDEVTISMTTNQPTRTLPCDVAIGSGCDVTIVVSARSHLLRKLDAALRRVFGDKYQVEIDLDGSVTSSADRTRESFQNSTSLDDDTRFSRRQVQVSQNNCPAGQRLPGSASRSTASTNTSSPGTTLHDKLASLPQFEYKNRKDCISAKPQLSSVTEISEPGSSRFKPRLAAYISVRKLAESELSKQKRQADLSNSSHLEAIIEGTVESSDTVKHPTLLSDTDIARTNILNQLIEEAQIPKERQMDSGIITGERTRDDIESEAIGDTPLEEPVTKKRRQKCTVVSKSTSDESNTTVNNDVVKDNNEDCGDFLQLFYNQEELTNEKNTAKPKETPRSSILVEPTIELVSKKGRTIKQTQKARANVTAPKKKQLPAKTKKMSTIIEQKDDEINTAENVLNIEMDTPVQRKNVTTENSTKRKRKLYNPKDNIDVQGKSATSTGSHIETVTTDAATCDILVADIRSAKVMPTDRTDEPKTTATLYKTLENEKNESARLQRLRNRRNEPPSPRTITNNGIFDRLKSTDVDVDNIKKTTVDVYNMTTDSEDNDFQIKTVIPIRKSLKSRTTSNEVAKKTRKPPQKKPAPKRKNKRKIQTTTAKSLEDERMRRGICIENTEVIHNSQMLDQQINEVFVLRTPIESEIVPECSPPKKKRTKKQSSNKKAKTKIIGNNNDSGSASPLPGLIIEPELTPRDESEFNAESTHTLEKIVEQLVHTKKVQCKRPFQASINEAKRNKSEAIPKVAEKRKNSPEKLSKGIINNIANEEIVPEILNRSDESLAAIGITACGDLFESPPNIDSLTDRVQPHELLDIGESNTQLMSNRLVEYDDCASLRSSCNKSPVVYMRRLSEEEISKWIPSCLTSASSSVVADAHFLSENILNVNEISKENTLPQTEPNLVVKNKNSMSHYEELLYKRFFPNKPTQAKPSEAEKSYFNATHIEPERNLSEFINDLNRPQERHQLPTIETKRSVAKKNIPNINVVEEREQIAEKQTLISPVSSNLLNHIGDTPPTPIIVEEEVERPLNRNLIEPCEANVRADQNQFLQPEPRDRQDVKKGLQEIVENLKNSVIEISINNPQTEMNKFTKMEKYLDCYDDMSKRASEKIRHSVSKLKSISDSFSRVVNETQREINVIAEDVLRDIDLM